MRYGPARRGFTLVELLVVIIIIGILATLAIPRLNQIRNSAKAAETASSLRVIHGALSSFGADNNGLYPFRVKIFEDNDVQNPAFNPADMASFPPMIHSEANPPFHSLGLFGGVEVVNPDFSDNTDDGYNSAGVNKHKIIQPFGWTYNDFYRYFNQYSDPLVAMGYLDSYPANPFLRRPMGAIMWGFGNANWNGSGPNRIDHTIPAPEVVPTPGDFVYTHFYQVNDAGELRPPSGVVPAKKSYTVEGSPVGGTYYVDVVDAYHLWAYGALPMNGGRYVAYPNNGLGLSGMNKQSAKKDWDNSGSRDLFELGMVTYFKSTGGTAAQAKDASGNKMEF